MTLGLAAAGLPAWATPQPGSGPDAAGGTGLPDGSGLGRLAGTAESTCRSLGAPLVTLVCACVFLGSLVAMLAVFQALRRQGWSLANALSEPTQLRIPQQPGWSDSQGDAQARRDETARAGAALPLTVLEPSSSRLIALLGSIAILLLYLGFGVFLLYNFGLSCSLPESTAAITNFLYAGLALFAPYVANKVASLFRPQSGSAGPAGAAGAADQPQRRPQPEPSVRAGVTVPPVRADEAPGASALAPAALEPAALAPDLRHPAAEPTAPAGSLPPAPPRGQATKAPAEVVPAGSGAAPAGSSPGPAVAADGLEPAVELIARFEGFVDHAYPDPASGGEPWTIGYGFTRLAGRAVRPGDHLSQAEADALLRQGVQSCAGHLAGRIPYWSQMGTDQRCALISFAWNVGEDFYGDSEGFATISRVLRERDWAAVPQALTLYVNPGSSVSAGLLRRREAEGALWARGLQPAAAASASPAGQSRPAVPQQANPLVVPWFDQLQMDDGQGWRDCFSASAAMLAAYWGRVGTEDTYNALRQRYGDSTSAEAQLGALRQLGLQAGFRTDGTTEDLRSEIDAGRPVAVGWLHHGPASDPSGGGHWTVVIGYDSTGVVMNDPYGNCDLVNGGYISNHDGAGLHYSYKNWLPRWRVGGSGGWMLTCRL
ncbi:MAG: C39 family peptidase [Synechococcaceae cyanobacterium]|nr:C39 family peptidase [Synechococcaceae cyanobacterium]